MTTETETETTEAQPLPRPEGVSGVAIDGKLHNPFSKADFTPAEYREIRDIVRENTGHHDIAQLNDPRVHGEVDLLPAVLFVVRRRTDPEFTYEAADKLAWDNVELSRMEQEAFAAWYDEHPDQDPRKAAPSGDEEEGEKRPPSQARRRRSSGS